MFSFLTGLELNLISLVVGLVLGAVFKTTLTDFFKGIPSELRTDLNGVEVSAVAMVKNAQAEAIAKVKNALPSPVPVAKVALPPAATPAAPAPVAQVVVQAATPAAV